MCVERKGCVDLFAILPNPGIITHQHHLSPFTFEVSCLDRTAGYDGQPAGCSRRAVVGEAGGVGV